jgi:hypothetical protein
MSSAAQNAVETEYPKGLNLEKVKVAATAIKKIRFQPATKDGQPVRVKIRAIFDCSQPLSDTSKP